MKTSSSILPRFCTVLAAALTLSATAARAVVWDVFTPSAAGIWSEMAKEGLVSDNAGNSWSIGYQNANTLNGSDALIVRRNNAGAITASRAYHPIAGDSYWYNGIAFDQATATLVVSGTHYIAATKTFEWFVDRLDPAALTSLAAWGGGRVITPASIGRGGVDPNTFGGRLVYTAAGVYAAGSSDRALTLVKLQLANGLFDAATWLASGPQPAGVRFTVGTVVPAHGAPGNSGGIYSKLPQSFVEIQGANVLVCGSVDYGAGARTDAVLRSHVQANGNLNWGVSYNNANQDEQVKAVASTAAATYIVGQSVGGAGVSFIRTYTNAGVAAGAAILTPGGIHNDVEALLFGGVDHVYVAGRSAANGIVLHFTNAGAGPVAAAVWANRAYGAAFASDQAVDLAVSAANTIYVTGSFVDTTSGMQTAAEMSVTAAGVVGGPNLALLRPFATGTAAAYNNVAAMPFTTANLIDPVGNALTEIARF